MAQTRQEAERIVNAYEALWNDRDYAAIPDLVSESFVMYDPVAPGGEVHGRDGLEEFIRETVSAFPDFQVTVVELLADGNLVLDEAEYTMTHEGELNGIPPTNREVEIRGMSKHLVEDGQLEEHWVYIDRQELFDQLGLTEE